MAPQFVIGMDICGHEISGRHGRPGPPRAPQSATAIDGRELLRLLESVQNADQALINEVGK
jgi:hypothetical protein